MPARQLAAYDLADLADAVRELSPERASRFARTLHPSDLAVLEEAMGRHLVSWRSDPAAMASFLDPSYELKPYIKLLSRKFREGIEGTSNRQIWNLPGRYGKSLGVQKGIVWALDRAEGACRNILVSYGQELADENADGIRTTLRMHADVLRCQLRADRQALHRYVTEQGGGVLAAGIDASITGFGVTKGGALVLDDPFKNWQAAHSEAQRDHVFNQFRGTLRNRLDDEDAFILIVMHRVHHDDIVARLKELMAADPDADQWDITALPAIAGQHDPLGRAPGDPLDPARFPLKALRARHATLGSYLASALEQQDPSPEEGTDLLRAWFRIEAAPPGPPDDCLTSWDFKLKDREAGDFVVGQAWWRIAGGYWLVDQIRGQFDHATTANAVALLCVRHPEIGRHVIEAAASADEVVPELRAARPDYEINDEMASRLAMNEAERNAVEELRRRGMSGLQLNPPKMDKRVRARTYIAPNAEAGDVHLAEDGPWVAALMDELASFPDGQHDDQIDAMSQALMKLSRKPGTVARATTRMPSLRPSERRVPRRPGPLSGR